MDIYFILRVIIQCYFIYVVAQVCSFLNWKKKKSKATSLLKGISSECRYGHEHAFLSCAQPQAGTQARLAHCRAHQGSSRSRDNVIMAAMDGRAAGCGATDEGA